MRVNYFVKIKFMGKFQHFVLIYDWPEVIQWPYQKEIWNSIGCVCHKPISI